MDALTLDAILKAEHDTLKQAVDEWLGMSDNRAVEDLAWVIGVNDFASNLVDLLTPEEKNGDING